MPGCRHVGLYFQAAQCRTFTFVNARLAISAIVNYRSMTVIDSDKLKDLLEAMRVTYGYDFTDYAEVSVKRRVTSFMNNRKINSVESLRELLLKDEKKFEEFIREISVTVTEMFRDPTFYLALRTQIGRANGTTPITTTS